MSLNISAAMVKELRDRTGSGIMDCKKALIESNGSLDKAMQILRSKGIISADKKMGRMASEGLVYAYTTPDKNVGVLIEVNCETDFVAKHDIFKKFVKEIAFLIAKSNPINQASLLSLEFFDANTIEDELKHLIHTFGENIVISRFKRFEVNGIGKVEAYIHDDYLTEGKIGVLVESAVKNKKNFLNPYVNSFIKSILMQIVAANPKYIKKEHIPESVISNEKTIILAQAQSQGLAKPVLNKFLDGKLQKFYKENCLLEQDFVMDPGKTVGEMLKAMNGLYPGENISVERFARFEKGETTE